MESRKQGSERTELSQIHIYFHEVDMENSEYRDVLYCHSELVVRPLVYVEKKREIGSVPLKKCSQNSITNLE